MILKNAKHEHFSQLVAGGKPPTAAYVLAGYSEHGAAQSANRLLKNAEIADRIAQLRKAVEEPARERAIEKAAVSKAWVLSELMENVSMAKQAVPVLNKKGEPTGEYQQNLSAANRALELLGKELGMFKDQLEVTDPRQRMTDDELREELRRLYQEFGIGIDRQSLAH